MKQIIFAVAFLLLASPMFGQTHKIVRPKAGATVAHSVTITFTASTSTGTGTAGIGYWLYRGTFSGGESTTPLNASPYLCTTACQFVNTIQLVEGTTYFYHIKTVDLATQQQSAPSAEVSATIPVTPPAVPVPPTGLSAVGK